MPGTNGLAFDWNGNLWTGDGTTGLGRVWKITPSGTVTEMFRVQPMANEVNLVNGTGGIGRDVRSLGPGTITVTATSRNAANTLGSQVRRTRARFASRYCVIVWELPQADPAGADP